jgi:hypothetical protein
MIYEIGHDARPMPAKYVRPYSFSTAALDTLIPVWVNGGRFRDAGASTAST